MHAPRIFISAASGDLRSIRQIVKEALLTIDCHPVEQTNFPPDARTVGNMLRGKIGDCQALIHICGMRYGAEPDPATLPPGTPRRSYTQMEYHIGYELQDERGDDRFRIYTFICPENFPYDEEPDTEPQEKRQFQLAHRARLFEGSHLWEKPRDADDLKARILAIQEQVFTLKQEQAEVKIEVLQNRHLGLKAFAILLFLLGGIYGGLAFINRHVETLPARVEDSIRKGYTVDAARIRIQLEAASQKKRDTDIAEANDIAQHPKWDDRQKLREEAEAAHQQRVSRVTQYAEDFAELASAQDASLVLIEMGRIIETEGVDAALAYFDTQRGDVLKRAKSRLSTAHEAVRRELQPSLKAAGLHATKGDSPAARASYQEILSLEPDWPEAIDAFAWFLLDASIQSKRHGSQRAALADAEAMLTLANHRQALAPADPFALRLLSVASNQVADVLILRRQPGDAEKALGHFQRCNEALEKLLSANPDSALAARDVSISLNKLGGFLALRGQPGDAEKAHGLFQRSNEVREKLLTANPDSAEAARDVSVSFEKLGEFLASRGQPGDAEKALGHFQRSLEVREKLHTTNPESAEAARDVSFSLEKLGGFLANRRGPGDAEKALGHFQRSLEFRGKFLTANPDSAEAARDVSLSLNRLGGFLASSGQPGDAEKALGHFQRSLEISEKLLTANPDSAEAARDVSISLEHLGDFLANRSQPGDAEKALAHFQRSLEVREKLLTANSDSAQAARDVSVSLNQLGEFLARRGQPGDAEKALAHFQRDLEISEKLLTANPDSAQTAWDVAVSHYNMATFAEDREDAAGKARHRRACYEILAPRIARGMTFDPPVMRVFVELKQEFGKE
ncbi:MAG: DUF4062 domain-containing protein [Verrucomicrobiota bacterium]